MLRCLPGALRMVLISVFCVPAWRDRSACQMWCPDYSKHVVCVLSRNPEAQKPCSFLLISIGEAPSRLSSSPAKSLPSGHQRLNSSKEGLQTSTGVGIKKTDKMLAAMWEDIQPSHVLNKNVNSLSHAHLKQHK